MTRDEILDEISCVERDLAAFRKSMDAIAERKLELESDSHRLALFMEWPATQALLNVQIMAITRCEGLLEDYRKLLEQTELPDNIVKLEKPHDID